jgi:hypothetical protein
MVAAGQRRSRPGPGWWPGPRGGREAPGHGGSASHHTDVRGLGPQVGDPQQGALTRNAAGPAGAQHALGDRACDGGAPARRPDQRTSSADHEQMVGRPAQAVISAHQNPASSRATAATTRSLDVLRVASRRNRPHRRSWAAHARATTWGPGPAGGGRSGRRRSDGAGRTRPTRPAGRPGGHCRPWSGARERSAGRWSTRWGPARRTP